MTAEKTQPPAPAAKDWPDNDEELVALGAKKIPANYWSLSDAFEGLQVFGGTGSGKSSGSGQTIARAFMEANFGGLVLTAKPDEVLNWKQHAAESQICSLWKKARRTCLTFCATN